MNTNPHSTQRQRGVGTLSIVMVLLVSASLFILFISRGLIFEQRSSANQLRAARALAAAESGLDWAVARLNDPRPIGAHCQAVAASGQSFRGRYLPERVGGGFTPAVMARPGCTLGASGTACACPVGGGASAVQGDAPSFSIELLPVAADAEAVTIISRGCSSAAMDCTPGSSTTTADAVVVVQSIVKLVPPWAALPVAAVTAGGAVNVASGVRLANLDVNTGGLLVDAGGAVSIDGPSASPDRLVTVPGSPVENAVLQRDQALTIDTAPRPQGEAAPDAFTRRFGLSLAQYRAHPAVHTLSPCSGSGCAAQIAAASAEGFSVFFVDGDLPLAAPLPGSAGADESRPVLIVATGSIRGVSGGAWFGLMHSTASGSVEVEGLNLQGALSAQGGLRLAGASSITYAPTVLQTLRSRLGSFARLPGSWRDGRCATDNASDPCGWSP